MNIESMYIRNSASLTGFLHSKENAIIIDIGGNYTRISPIREGFL